jgi:hypothetical protein
MSFSTAQVRALRRAPDRRQVRIRAAHGRQLAYIEGWFAIAEANRIFGFDGWDRETIEFRCIGSRENRGTFTTIYLAKVRVTVRASGSVVVREGHGTGEGKAEALGEAHEFALKAAETDATKRALSTFGKPFGLALYGNGKLNAETPRRGQRPPPDGLGHVRKFEQHYAPHAIQHGGHPGGETQPPSHSPSLNGQHIRGHANARETARQVAATPDEDLQPAIGSEGSPSPQREPETQTAATDPGDAKAGLGRIDKSVLTIGMQPRRRDRSHLKFVAMQPCMICGRLPSDAHHLRFAQPRALGRKVSDEHAVPLCRIHHREVHRYGNELAWWTRAGLDPAPVAEKLWNASRKALGSEGAHRDHLGTRHLNPG